jgi:hypothetical protein
MTFKPVWNATAPIAPKRCSFLESNFDLLRDGACAMHHFVCGIVEKEAAARRFVASVAQRLNIDGATNFQNASPLRLVLWQK